ncbi:MAG: hypothetical protein ABSF71_40370, partial [Terriglobia bacterium]
HIRAVSAVLRPKSSEVSWMKLAGRSIANTACSSKPRAYGYSMVVGSAGVWNWRTVVKGIGTVGGRLREERKAGRR